MLPSPLSSENQLLLSIWNKGDNTPQKHHICHRWLWHTYLMLSLSEYCGGVVTCCTCDLVKYLSNIIPALLQCRNVFFFFTFVSLFHLFVVTSCSWKNICCFNLHLLTASTFVYLPACIRVKVLHIQTW